MITGMNTVVRYEGAVYHVRTQTDQRGFCMLEPTLSGAPADTRPSLIIEAASALGVVEVVIPVAVPA